MTKTQLLKDQSRAITDALSLVPKDIRPTARPAVEQALIAGVGTAVQAFTEAREESACSYCQTFLSRVIKPLIVEQAEE